MIRVFYAGQQCAAEMKVSHPKWMEDDWLLNSNTTYLFMLPSYTGIAAKLILLKCVGWWKWVLRWILELYQVEVLTAWAPFLLYYYMTSIIV